MSILREQRIFFVMAMAHNFGKATKQHYRKLMETLQQFRTRAKAPSSLSTTS